MTGQADSWWFLIWVLQTLLLLNFSTVSGVERGFEPGCPALLSGKSSSCDFRQGSPAANITWSGGAADELPKEMLLFVKAETR